MIKSIIAATTAITLLAAGTVIAQQHGGHAGHGSHSGHGSGSHSGHSAAAQADNAAVKAYRAANDKMHADMDVKFSGDADADFLRGMIPHHQGAIDMARVVLEHGKNPEIRRLAEHIIAEQEKEIAQMKALLAKHGG